MKHISISINGKEDLSEKYNSSVLSNEINSYILNECLPVRKNEKIVIDILSSNELEEEDKLEIEKLIKNNYKNLRDEKNIIKEYQYKQSIVITIIGIIFIVMSNILKNESILSELFLIAGWVSLWEVIYKVLFGRVKDKIEIERYKKLSKCKINFTMKKKP
ncbi:MAG: hypothetical protein ACI31S_01220 [Bacilli bacterium]